MSSLTFSDAEVAGLGDAGGLQLGVVHADVGIQAAAGGGDGIGGHRLGFGQAIVRAIGGDAFLDGDPFSFCEVGPRLLPLELAAS